MDGEEEDMKKKGKRDRIKIGVSRKISQDKET